MYKLPEILPYADGVSSHQSVEPDLPPTALLTRLTELEAQLASVTQSPTYGAMVDDGSITRLQAILTDTIKLVPKDLLPLLTARTARAGVTYWHSILRASHDPCPEHEAALEHAQHQYQVAEGVTRYYHNRDHGFLISLMDVQVKQYQQAQQASAKCKRKAASTAQASSSGPASKLRRSARLAHRGKSRSPYEERPRSSNREL